MQLCDILQLVSITGLHLLHFHSLRNKLYTCFYNQVGDLGLSKVKCQTLISGGVRGTLPWMAPELLNGSSSLVSEKVNLRAC